MSENKSTEWVTLLEASKLLALRTHWVRKLVKRSLTGKGPFEVRKQDLGHYWRYLISRKSIEEYVAHRKEQRKKYEQQRKFVTLRLKVPRWTDRQTIVNALSTILDEFYLSEFRGPKKTTDIIHHVSNQKPEPKPKLDFLE